jgi:hypothetical protein
VICVDTWQYAATKVCGDEDWLALFHESMEPLTNYVPMVMTSAEAARQLSDTRFDMVFIDADHDYGKVKEDILAWRPLLVPGGLLCGHDYSWEEWGVGVIRAVDELLPDRQVGPESIWWVQ